MQAKEGWWDGSQESRGVEQSIDSKNFVGNPLEKKIACGLTGLVTLISTLTVSSFGVGTKKQSSLIKQLLHIRDEMVIRQGSIENAVISLESWFGRNKGLGHAYDFFLNKIEKWS